MPQRTAAGDSLPVGFRWELGRDAAGRRIVFHGGDTIGGRAFLLAFPDDGLVVAIVANLGVARFAEREGTRLGGFFLP